MQSERCILRLGTETFEPQADATLWWPTHGILIAADLHLEKGSSFARSGQLLPPYDSLATLERLKRAVASTQPKTLILLGDSLHDGGALDRLPDIAMQIITDIATQTEMIWVTGNHDPEPDDRLPGRAVDRLEVAGICLRHIPSHKVDAPEIAGHFHPVARVSTAKGQARRKAFIADERRLIVPAFGAYAGGMNVLEPELISLFQPDGLKAYLCGSARVFPVKGENLVPDKKHSYRVRA